MWSNCFGSLEVGGVCLIGVGGGKEVGLSRVEEVRSG